MTVRDTKLLLINERMLCPDAGHTSPVSACSLVRSHLRDTSEPRISRWYYFGSHGINLWAFHLIQVSVLSLFALLPSLGEVLLCVLHLLIIKVRILKCQKNNGSPGADSPRGVCPGPCRLPAPGAQSGRWEARCRRWPRPANTEVLSPENITHWHVPSLYAAFVTIMSICVSSKSTLTRSHIQSSTRESCIK